MHDNSVFTALPEWQRQFNKYMNASTWPEAVCALGALADIEGVPLEYGDDSEVLEHGDDDGSSLYVSVGGNYGIAGITAHSFYYTGG